MSLASTKKAKKSKLKNGSVKLTDTYEYRIGYRDDLAPLSTVEEWFADLSSNIKKLGFKRFIDHLNGRALRVATMCSGTESPILALKMISDSKFLMRLRSTLLFLTFLYRLIESVLYQFRRGTSVQCRDRPL